METWGAQISLTGMRSAASWGKNIDLVTCSLIMVCSIEELRKARASWKKSSTCVQLEFRIKKFPTFSPI